MTESEKDSRLVERANMIARAAVLPDLEARIDALKLLVTITAPGSLDRVRVQQLLLHLRVAQLHRVMEEARHA